MKKTHLLFIVSILLANVVTTLTTWASTDTHGDDHCDYAANLLANPDFTQDERGRRYPWSSAQHAGERSFELTVKDGVARIRKTGNQHWFTLNQRIPIETVRGHKLHYAAELKLDLNNKGVRHAFGTGGGLTVFVRGAPGSGPDGNGILFNSRFEHEPHMGQHDWTAVAIEFTVPDEARSMRIGIAHYAGGELSVRKPVLKICD
ncbi:MAG: hypothetical protein ACK5ME_09945 [Parahaliea sp.]